MRDQRTQPTCCATSAISLASGGFRQRSHWPKSLVRAAGSRPATSTRARSLDGRAGSQTDLHRCMWASLKDLSQPSHPAQPAPPSPSSANLDDRVCGPRIPIAPAAPLPSMYRGFLHGRLRTPAGGVRRVHGRHPQTFTRPEVPSSLLSRRQTWRTPCAATTCQAAWSRSRNSANATIL